MTNYKFTAITEKELVEMFGERGEKCKRGKIVQQFVHNEKTVEIVRVYPKEGLYTYEYK